LEEAYNAKKKEEKEGAQRERSWRTEDGVQRQERGRGCQTKRRTTPGGQKSQTTSYAEILDAREA
jgi:hypothetical protein